jgi:hypothetical protein
MICVAVNNVLKLTNLYCYLLLYTDSPLDPVPMPQFKTEGIFFLRVSSISRTATLKQAYALRAGRILYPESFVALNPATV